MIQALLKSQGTHVSWNSLARELTIDHPKTVAEYIELLAQIPPLTVEAKGIYAEAVVHQHLRRHGPSFYIKAEGEVDAVRLLGPSPGPRFQPIEVKWTTQIRSKDLKQIRKYPNGAVWGRHPEPNANPPILDLCQEILQLS